MIATTTDHPIDHEMQVNLAIFDFHAAADRGESPDPALWEACYPEIAAELHVYFEDLAGIDVYRPQPLAIAGRGCEPGIHPADFQPGDVLGDYVLREKLGEGGQGVVWKASPRRSPHNFVALKTQRGPAKSDEAAVYRLRKDAHAIARMKHAHIIRTFFLGEDRGRWYFVIELMEGGTVADRLALYQADARAASVLMEKIARAIHHAHTRNPGVLHLDLKPGNILLTADGEPKVTDFGLSVRVETIDDSRQDSPQGQYDPPDDADVVSATFERAGIVGTLPYISPEMAEGRWSDVSTASDIYGLGAILYEMLSGRPPFRGETIRETLALVIGGELKSARELTSKVDRELNAVCRKCLDRNPAKRYGSADALANDLRRWLESRPTLAGGKPSAAREIRFWVRRHPLALALAGVAAVFLWIASVAISINQRRIENGREATRLAHQVDRELRLIRGATQILARGPKLRAAFASFPARAQAAQRRGAIEAYLTSAVEGENLFGITGGNPLVNVFVLDPDGVMLADTFPMSAAVGKNYRVRDYYRAFFENIWPRDYVYVARSFPSMKDSLYKIAVSTRISSDRDELLGILVANFTIGSRLIDVDMRHEPNDAAVLCPMDRSDPVNGIEDPGPPWRYIVVLDQRYTVGWKDKPFDVDLSLLPGFQNDAMLGHVTGGLVGGSLVDYQRVGETNMVVVMRRKCPWPLTWLPDFRWRHSTAP